jgi:hypothetical protein
MFALLLHPGMFFTSQMHLGSLGDVDSTAESGILQASNSFKFGDYSSRFGEVGLKADSWSLFGFCIVSCTTTWYAFL